MSDFLDTQPLILTPCTLGVPNPHTGDGNNSVNTAEYEDMAMLTPEEMKDFAIQHIIQMEGTLNFTRRQNEEIQREHNTLKALLDRFKVDAQRQLDGLREDTHTLRQDLHLIPEQDHLLNAIRDLATKARDDRKQIGLVNRAASQHCSLLQQRITEFEAAKGDAANEREELLDLVHELGRRVEQLEHTHDDSGLWDRVGQLEVGVEQVQLSGLEIVDRQDRHGQMTMNTIRTHNDLEVRVVLLEKAFSQLAERIKSSPKSNTVATTSNLKHALGEEIDEGENTDDSTTLWENLEIPPTPLMLDPNYTVATIPAVQVLSPLAEESLLGLPNTGTGALPHLPAGEHAPANPILLLGNKAATTGPTKSDHIIALANTSSDTAGDGTSGNGVSKGQETTEASNGTNFPTQDEANPLGPLDSTEDRDPSAQATGAIEYGPTDDNDNNPSPCSPGPQLAEDSQNQNNTPGHFDMAKVNAIATDITEHSNQTTLGNVIYAPGAVESEPTGDGNNNPSPHSRGPNLCRHPQDQNDAPARFDMANTKAFATDPTESSDQTTPGNVIPVKKTSSTKPRALSVVPQRAQAVFSPPKTRSMKNKELPVVTELSQGSPLTPLAPTSPSD